MWLSHQTAYQPGLIKRMGENVPALRRMVKMPVTMRWLGALVPARVGVARASDDYSVVCSTVYNRARRNLSKMLNARCRKKHIEDARGQNIEDARCRNIENTRCRNIEDARVANRKPKEAV